MVGSEASRHVACHIEAEVESRAEVVLSIAVADGVPDVDEALQVTLDGRTVPARPLSDDHGARLHHLVDLAPGHLEVDYRSTVTGTAPPPPVTEIDLVRYRRPSRYCESDRMFAMARAEFHDLEGQRLVDAVTSWVGQRIAYVSGSSRPIDGAVSTSLSREGVCRDFAHLVIALLRGCDVPARFASVYAPGLDPMDFHAVAEVFVDGRWLVVDATAKAPRTSMVRIATGRDAADAAFLSSIGGAVKLDVVEVMATVDGRLPGDDPTVAVELR